MRKLLLLSLLALSYQSASAQLVTESFGSGDNAFTMDFVTIGNPNNAADTTVAPNPAGSVAYIYNIGKYEVSRGQIDKANSAGSLGITMFDMSGFGGNGGNRPATGVSWYEAATYVNWLNESKGYQAAYKFVGGTFQLWSSTDAGYNANNMFRNSLAKYVIASGNEWYKAAYGKADGSWSNFPNGTDIAPTAVASGTDANTAVFGQSWSAGPADIDNAGGLSPYGTMGQGGNVWEYNETAYDGNNDTALVEPEMRGGAWYNGSDRLDASDLIVIIKDPPSDYFSHGFRIASVPEPSSLSLMVLGGLVMALRRRR
jgi:hypothetical protein